MNVLLMLHIISVFAALVSLTFIAALFATFSTTATVQYDSSALFSVNRFPNVDVSTPAKRLTERKSSSNAVSSTGLGDGDSDDHGASRSISVDHSQEGRLSGNVEKSPKRVALAFYGLTRSLKYTVDSIKENVMDKLTEAGYEYDVYLHTYDLSGLENSRSGESSRLNTSEWRLLNPDHFKVTNQDEFLEEYKLPIEACKSFSIGSNKSASATDYYEDDFKSIQNLLCQLNSLETVTSMWRESEVNYHAVLYLRPDMLYNCPLPVETIDHLRRDSVYIADFHHWYGYNDRFAMGKPEAVGLWGDRLQYTLSTCMRQQIHAESLVGSLLDHYHLKAQLVPFYFFRVRSNGLLEERDFKPRWKSHEIPTCNQRMFIPFQRRATRLAEKAAAAAIEAGGKTEGGKEDLRREGMTEPVE